MDPKKVCHAPAMEDGPRGSSHSLTITVAYNDIAAWDHTAMLEFFGAKDGRASSRQARTRKEFEEAFGLPDYEQPASIQVSHLPTLHYQGLLDEY